MARDTGHVEDEDDRNGQPSMDEVLTRIARRRGGRVGLREAVEVIQAERRFTTEAAAGPAEPG